jgi:hypothetical protein
LDILGSLGTDFTDDDEASAATIRAHLAGLAGLQEPSPQLPDVGHLVPVRDTDLGFGLHQRRLHGGDLHRA